MTEAQHTTWGFAILGLDVVIFIICNMAAVVRAGQASMGFWLLSCTFVFQSAAVPGLRFFKSPNIAKPCSLCVTLNDIPLQTMSKDKLKNFINLPLPTDDIDFFEEIKIVSNNYWTETDINKGVYGFQIQKGSRWRDGLTDNDIAKFEDELGYKFPISLRNFYKTMNGLDKQGINVFGNSGHEFQYRPIYYSYPDDLQLIKGNIEWIYEATSVNADKLMQNGISRIFPVCGHRFVLVDDPKNRVLSMYGNDIIAWSDNISKLIATDIFDKIYNASDFESNLNDFDVKFWTDEE